MGSRGCFLASLGSLWAQHEARLGWPQGGEPSNCCAPAQIASECPLSQLLVQAEGSKIAVEKDRCPVPEAQSLVYRPKVLVCSLSSMPKLCPGPEEQPLTPAPGAKLCSCCHRALACPTIWASWPSLSRTGVTKGPKYKSTVFAP